MLGKAISIASEAFKNKKDKGGDPYILHCLYVMDQVKHLGKDAMIVAVLHDLLEDCIDWNVERLISEGFLVEHVHALDFLTHNRDNTYMEYIEKLSHSELCVEIKKADLRHNSDITRLKGITEKDHQRNIKYNIAYHFLDNLDN